MAGDAPGREAMDRTKALAAVCLFLVLLGGSMSLALADSSRDAANPSEQIAVPSGQAGSVIVEIQPEEHRILRDQSAFFVARIDGFPEAADAFLLRLQTNSDANEVSYEAHHDAARVLDWPLRFPEADAVVYVRNTDSDGVAHVPFTLSPETKFSVEQRTLEASVWTENLQQVGEGESQIGIRCPIGCQIELGVEWLNRNLERIATVLGLLIAFFGRKKIWALLRVPKARLAGTARGKREHRGERDRETE